ncbi:MAG: LemA family protein [Bdellovibrionales bacterium]
MKKLILSFSAVVLLSGCGLQSIPTAKNSVDAALSEITNQYKRRADLIPNLVNVVKGYAKHEKETLEGVTEMRSRATSVTIDPSNATPEQLSKYAAAQGQLSQALGKLLAISENYPQLKADQNFRDLQAQLEGTENRITVARQRYIEAVQQYNNLVTVPPTSWFNALFYKHPQMAQWDVSADEKAKIEKAPEVNL